MIIRSDASSHYSFGLLEGRPMTEAGDNFNITVALYINKSITGMKANIQIKY